MFRTEVHGALVDIARRCEALLTAQRWTVPAGVPLEALSVEQRLLRDTREALELVEAEGERDAHDA